MRPFLWVALPASLLCFANNPINSQRDFESTPTFKALKLVAPPTTVADDDYLKIFLYYPDREDKSTEVRFSTIMVLEPNGAPAGFKLWKMILRVPAKRGDELNGSKKDRWRVMTEFLKLISLSEEQRTQVATHLAAAENNRTGYHEQVNLENKHSVGIDREPDVDGLITKVTEVRY